MKTINVNLVQPRVDNVAGNKQTAFAIMACEDGSAYITEASEVNEWRGYGFRQVADVIVSHPAIMCGDYNEIKSDFLYEIEKAAITEGLCFKNQAEVLFVK